MRVAVGKRAELRLQKVLMKYVRMQKNLLGKILVTEQTGPEGKEVKRLTY